SSGRRRFSGTSRPASSSSDPTVRARYNLPAVITGFNTDVKHRNRVFHIQTEDKGEANPYVESLVYVGGEILATKRTSYAEVIKVSGRDDHAVQDLMEQQHR